MKPILHVSLRQQITGAVLESRRELRLANCSQVLPPLWLTIRVEGCANALKQSGDAGHLSSRWRGTRDGHRDLDATVSLHCSFGMRNPTYMMNISVLRHSWKLPSELLVDEKNLAVF